MVDRKIQTPEGEKTLILLHQVDEETRELAIKAMDKADDAAVVQALTLGKDTDANVYAFSMGGKDVHGISITGMTNLWLEARKGAFPRESQLTITEIPYANPECKAPNATALRIALLVSTAEGESAWGFIAQPTWYRRRDGSWSFDEHAEAKGISKARRNAMKALIQPSLAEKFMKKCLAQKGKVKQLTKSDAQGASAETSMKATVRARIMSISTRMGLDCGQDPIKNAVIAYIEKAVGMPMSEMPEAVLLKAKNEYEEWTKKVTRDEFRAAVLGGAA